MIYLFSGTPGSGKSLHAVYDIYKRLSMGKYVVANFPIDFNTPAGRKIARHKDKFIYLPNEDVSIRTMLKISLVVSKIKGFSEKNILWVVDEAGCIWNSRQYNHHERMDWIRFFSQHRKFGYNVIMISQSDRMLDKQIRALIETEVTHRKANNFKMVRFLPFPVFVMIERWYAAKNEKINSSFFFFNRKKSKLYNSYATFDMYAELMEELSQLSNNVKEEIENVRREKRGVKNTIGSDCPVKKIHQLEGQEDGGQEAGDVCRPGEDGEDGQENIG